MSRGQEQEQVPSRAIPAEDGPFAWQAIEDWGIREADLDEAASGSPADDAGDAFRLHPLPPAP